MSGFGGFGTGTTGGGLFGSKPPEQASTGFSLSTTTATTASTGLTFGTPTFGGTATFGTQQQTPAFGTQQQTPAFGTQAPAFGTQQQTGFGTQQQTPAFGGFGVKPATLGTGFNFGATSTNTATPTFGASATNTAAPTFGAPATNTVTPSFGISSTSAPGTGFSLSTTSTTLPTFGASATTSFGTPSVNFNVPKTTGVTGFTMPAATTATPSFNFGSTTATTTTTTTLNFGVTTTAAATTASSTAPTLSFGMPTSGSTTTTQSTGFTLSQPTTTSTLTFGTPTTTKGLTFGTPTTGFSLSTTTATLTFNLGTKTTAASSLGGGLMGTPKTSDGTPGTISTTASTGLGGVDSKQTTQGLSGPGTVEPKHVKDNTLPEIILQTLNEFQNFTKQQKSLSVEISHGSSKPLKKVQEDTEAMESLLTMITSGLTRNAIAVDKLKTETAQGLHQAELAQRNHETPPGLDYDNSAPADYFNDLVTKFETDTVRLRVQIEASEKHLRSLTQSSTISPQELTLAMRRLHETLIVLAARVQALHTSVQSQKEQFKNLRRVYFKDDTNIFENETDHSLVKKQTIYSLRSLTGPTPFSENPGGVLPFNVDGLAMLASSTGPSTPATSVNSSWMSPVKETGNTSLLQSSNVLGGLQPVEVPGFQLNKPPTGSKRNKH